MNTINVKDLMSISGKGGLFRFLAQARNGVVVESLQDKKRQVAPATARVSSLEDIAIFTTEEDMPLSEVFMKIHEKEDGGVSIDSKTPSEGLKSYFREVLPDYDDERVYISDIKKVLTWYNLLHQLELLEVIESKEEDEGDKTDADEASDKSAEETKNEEDKKEK